MTPRNLPGRALASSQALLFATAAMILGGCPDSDSPVDAAPLDAAVDGSIDATIDASIDATVDATPGPDAALDCNVAIDCELDLPGRTSLCGRVFDSATTATFLPDAFAYRVAAYDALALAGGLDPEPLAIVEPDACGRFALEDVTVPAAAFIIILVDDPQGVDQLVSTAVAVPGVADQEITGLNAFATRKASDAAWTTSAGLTGDSFAARGAYLPIFIDTSKPPAPPFTGTPAPGVTVTADGLTTAANDFYFSDTGALLRETPVARGSATGANGAALYLNGQLENHSGTGGEPAGCSWPSNLAASLAGTVFVQELRLVCN